MHIFFNIFTINCKLLKIFPEIYPELYNFRKLTKKVYGDRSRPLPSSGKIYGLVYDLIRRTGIEIDRDFNTVCRPGAGHRHFIHFLVGFYVTGRDLTIRPCQTDNNITHHTPGWPGHGDCHITGYCILVNLKEKVLGGGGKGLRRSGNK